MILQLWFQRSDAESVTLFSPPVEAASVRDVSILMNIVNVGTATAAVQAQQSLDPNDPNSWSNVGSSASGAAAGNFTGLAGGVAAGTTVPLGPYLRFVATVSVTTGGLVWSASAVMRNA